MAEDYSAQTIRIDLHPEQAGHDDATVTFCSPIDGVGDTSFDAQSQSQIAGRSDSAYQRLLECIYDAVLITDSKGMVLECNQRAIDFLKYMRDDILGVPVSYFVCGIDESVLSSILKNLLEHRYTLIEGSCQRSDESVFPTEIAVNRLDLSATGRLCFLSGTYQYASRLRMHWKRLLRKLRSTTGRGRSLFQMCRMSYVHRSLP